MSTAGEAAPEIDRLVLSVGGSVEPVHGSRLAGIARSIGLDDRRLLTYFADFMLAGSLTPDLAIARLPYAPAEDVRRGLDELEERGLLVEWGSRLGASPGLRHLLLEMGRALAAEAAAAWGSHPDAVATASRLATAVAGAASDDHLVAVAHRECPEPNDPYQRLHKRLVTLRYIRQHDHVQAWRARGLDAGEIVALTRLWRAESTDDLAVPQRLADLGYVSPETPSLTTAGRTVREDIEADTNHRAQESFAILDERTSTEFLAALRALPG